MASMPFLFIGNHPCLDFVNTQPVLEGQPVELLAAFPDLVRWCTEAQLLTNREARQYDRRRSGQETEEDVIEQARVFRGTLRQMIGQLVSHKPVPQAAVEAINEHLRSCVGYPQVSRRQGQFERSYHVEPGRGERLLGILAESAADLLTARDLSLIKKCQNPACVLFFYDTTKNHARQWCSMNACGNRSKVAAHYRRHRERKKRQAT